jgi:hypothetical protein
MLDRSVPTRKALIHSILISEVNNMKEIFYSNSRHLFLKLTLICIFDFEIDFNNFKKIVHRIKIVCYNILTIGIKILKYMVAFLVVLLLFSFHTCSNLMIF